ncbi:MAG: tRNA uridine-5-carboxymethylaminomethyl(34) synthesis GTPase MnmE [Oscillospiraceae bacterium]|nr:tRNA uridine-5-carboxymethylaminomethyl(34) synthesis GTPase MnmE [Oscillospiraceae bacterium]
MPSPTIAAIATAQAPGGIGVIRISGHAAFDIAQHLFSPKKPLDYSQLRHHTMAYGTLHDFPAATNQPPAQPSSNKPLGSFLGKELSPRATEEGSRSDAACISAFAHGYKIDDIICLLFPAPHSYTGEHVVEFQCHGGMAVMQRALQAVFSAGAQPAGPGEFTRRAYENGRLNLTQAEAVMQLIAATSEQAARAAQAAMGGALSQAIDQTRANLIALQAHISAWVDYPEEDIDALQSSEITHILNQAQQELHALIARAPRDNLMLQGINTALVGRPNVGKSSLLNVLAGYDRAIVTPTPGTTRDTVTETVQLGNLTLRLTDTAGIRATDDAIEAAGVQRSRAALAQADLILAVFDASQPLTTEDHDLLAQCDPARTVIVFNKSDLQQQTPRLLPREGAPAAAGEEGSRSDCDLAASPFTRVSISALQASGIDTLTQAIEQLLNTSSFNPNEAMLANQRQRDTATQALAAIEEALYAHESGYPLDAVSICIEDAITHLFALTGERTTDAVVDEVFARFCVGK